MSRQLLLWEFTSSLAGLLFGFDTVVISGAEKVIQNLWGLSNTLHGFAMASALWGTVVGSVVGAWPAERFGRKPTLQWIGAAVTFEVLTGKVRIERLMVDELQSIWKK